MKRSEDRRSTIDDRRESHSIEYWDNPSAVERRSFPERRQQDEQREGWKRISEWSSMYTEDE